MTTPTDLILVSWNSADRPLSHLLVDGRPRFELLLFDYTGRSTPSPDAPVQLPGLDADLPVTLLSEATECKGDIYQALARHLQRRGQRLGEQPRFVGMIDDDILISVQDLNRLLHIGGCHGLHAFSASLAHDCEYTHRWTLHQPHRIWRPVPWIEVMMPVYDAALFLEAAPHFEGNVSSWGIDNYLMPVIQRLSGRDRCGIVDAVMASHVRPITSDQRVYRNGLNARQEAQKMKALAQALVRERQPGWEGDDWWRRTFERRHVRTRWQQLATGLGRPLRRWLDGST